jgi:hypothetical protein
MDASLENTRQGYDHYLLSFTKKISPMKNLRKTTIERPLRGARRAALLTTKLPRIFPTSLTINLNPRAVASGNEYPRTAESGNEHATDLALLLKYRHRQQIHL